MVSPVNAHSSRMLPAPPRQESQPARMNAEPSAQTGRETSGPLSGIRTQAAAAGSRGFATTASANSQAAVTQAEEIIRATGRGRPSIEGSSIANEAYVTEIQAQRQAVQGSTNGSGMHEWSA